MIKEFKEEKTKPTKFQTNIILQLQSRSISPLGVQKDRKGNTRLEIYLSAVTKLTVTVPQQTARSRPHSPTPDMDCCVPSHFNPWSSLHKKNWSGELRCPRNHHIPRWYHFAGFPAHVVPNPVPSVLYVFVKRIRSSCSPSSSQGGRVHFPLNSLSISINFQTAPYSQPPTPAVPDHAGLSEVGLQQPEATNQAVHERSGRAICLQQLLIWGRHQLGQGKGHQEAPVRFEKAKDLQIKRWAMNLLWIELFLGSTCRTQLLLCYQKPSKTIEIIKPSISAPQSSSRTKASCAASGGHAQTQWGPEACHMQLGYASLEFLAFWSSSQFSEAGTQKNQQPIRWSSD